MRLMTLLAILNLFSCSSIPSVDCTKPDSYICTIYAEKGSKIEQLFCKNIRTGVTKSIDIFEAHKFICSSPDDYNSIGAWKRNGCQ